MSNFILQSTKEKNRRPVKKRKETTGEPFEWFPGPSIDQSLALDLRRMEVGKPTIEYVGADAERSCSRRRSVTDAACPLRVLIGPQVLVLLGSSTERRCAERRDLSGGRERRDGQLITKILRGQFRTTVHTSPLSFLGRPKPFFSFWQRKKRMVLEKYSKMNIQQKEFVMKYDFAAIESKWQKKW